MNEAWMHDGPFCSFLVKCGYLRQDDKTTIYQVTLDEVRLMHISWRACARRYESAVDIMAMNQGR